MTRLLATLGLAIVLAGCTSEATPSQGASTQSLTASVPPATLRGPLPAPPTPAPTPAESIVPTGLVAYATDGVLANEPGSEHIWMVNADGTGARELLPNVPGSQVPLAWSGDGSRLLYLTESGVAMTDAAGAAPVEFELQCPLGADTDAVLSSCQADTDTVALSPDGTRLAYPIWDGTHDQGDRTVTSVLVILDLEAEVATRLESTAAMVQSEVCTDPNSGGNQSPSWSADGRLLMFARATRAAGTDDCEEAILTVKVDDGDLRQIVAPGQLEGPLRPSWSPDGSTILVGATVPDATGTKEVIGGDIYTVRSDGTGLHAVTSDGLSYGPSWTRDGRIAFIRWSDRRPGVYRGDQWVMDADGGNARRIESTIPALSAAGCTICAYSYQAFDSAGSPIEVQQSPPLGMWETIPMLWQPVPVDQP